VPARLSRWIHPLDFVWFLLFAALAVTYPDVMNRTADASEIALFTALGIAQVLEPKIPALAVARGRAVWIVIKLALSFLLIGYTTGLTSPYWPVLLLPVMTAATGFGIVGTLLFVLLAILTDVSFFSFVDWQQFEPAIGGLVLRGVFLMMIGILANMLAEELRLRSTEHRRAAERLAEANANLQAAEEAVRRSDRLAALGQLSAGLAHELRNPLGTVRTSAEMLARNVSAENEVAREVAGFIVSEVDRTNSLVTRFLQFARPLELRLEDSDLAQTLDRAIAAAAREAPEIAIYKNYAPEIPPFPFDAELLERVIYNLVLNAAQASPPGGAVTVKTRAAAGTAEIAVIDRGAGIDRKHIDTIFNPFFTTKPHGVGLGLAIVSKIVDEHGGKITVESEPGKGSIFRVLLPMRRPAPQPSA